MRCHGIVTPFSYNDDMPSPLLLAAIDLGSNSFRLEIGRESHGQISRVDYLKETVRQGGGMDENRNLSPQAMQAGWDCLARFGERLSGFKPRQVRAVATQTLREARNRDEFLQRACTVLGFPIEVVSGPEEARLIYLGVSHLLPQSDERRLVIDIGGRSTELILGCQLEPSVMNSYRVGSVAWSMKYFDGGELTPQAFERSRIAAQAILDETLSAYGRSLWDTAYGSSGTVGAVGDILVPQGQVTREGLDWLKRYLIRAQHVSRVKLAGLKEDRKSVIGGGISVLDAIMDLLSIDTLQVAQGALRHGVLFDMLDRESVSADVRNQTVLRLQTTYGVDVAQSKRVTQVARHFMQSLLRQHPEEDGQRLLHKLEWACQLHEIGQVISHSDYHKHGAYILDHADVTGFALPELHRLSLLVLGHRGKLRKLEVDFDDIGFCMQLMCLRLAVILCHARRDPDHQELALHLSAKHHAFELQVSPKWLQEHPQSAHLLREEIQAWQKTGWGLELSAALSSN
jgi:exopolyphosphatase/guanosine-5'-triphosphate,3'-diphosphate pyrophosphatase